MCMDYCALPLNQQGNLKKKTLYDMPYKGKIDSLTLGTFAFVRQEMYVSAATLKFI